MKRLYFAIGLLVLLIALCVTEQRLVSKVHYTSTKIISQALTALEADDQSELEGSCRKLNDYWQENYTFMSAMIDHNCFDDASLNIKKVQYMAENGDEELKSTLLELKSQIDEIKEDEQITFGNIF